MPGIKVHLRFKREWDILVKLRVQDSFLLCISQSFPLVGGWAHVDTGQPWFRSPLLLPVCGLWQTVGRNLNVLGIITTPLAFSPPQPMLCGFWSDQKGGGYMRELICWHHTKAVGILHFCSLNSSRIPMAPRSLYYNTTWHYMDVCFSGERGCSFCQVSKGFPVPQKVHKNH